MNRIFDRYEIDYVEIIAPMVKPLVYWHVHALGFTLIACSDIESGRPCFSSYLLKSGKINLLLTSAYPMSKVVSDESVRSFIAHNYCGVKRIALKVDSVKDVFAESVSKGAFPVLFPTETEDTNGSIVQAAIRLYDDREIVFCNRSRYGGIFQPGYNACIQHTNGGQEYLSFIDHIAAELRINECNYWSDYLTRAIGTEVVQSIRPGAENKTGMILNINQSFDRNLTLVMAEPDSYRNPSKVQKNIDAFGPGIHHLAFSTDDLVSAAKIFKTKGVEFVNFPSSYYNLLRNSGEFHHLEAIDIDVLEENGIIVDKEGDTFLLQKFIKPISDRPFFLYEIVQRVNGYNGFALKNINVLKKAEEMEIANA
jgi:4-hydroxyphenylpyruvate dioxygenase